MDFVTFVGIKYMTAMHKSWDGGSGVHCYGSNKASANITWK